MPLKVNLFDTVVYTKHYAAEPVKKHVVRLTPKGRFQIQDIDGLFEQPNYNDICHKWNGDREYCYLLNKYDDLKQIYLTAKQEAEQKETEQKEKKRLKQEKYNSEMILVKSIFHFPEEKIILPNGDRIFIIKDLPQNPNIHEEHRIVFAVIHLKTITNSWIVEEGKNIEMHYTCTQNKSSYGNFASYSSVYCKNDDDAVWNALRYFYFNT